MESMDWTPALFLPWGAGIGAAAEPLATADGPFRGPDPHCEARKANLAAFQFEQALLFPHRLPPTVGQPGEEGGRPLPQPPGETFQRAPLLPSLSSPTRIASSTSIAQAESMLEGAVQVGATPPRELVVGPVSPPPEERRKKFKRARVMKEIKEPEVGQADSRPQEGPLHKEREQMGASVRRFVARMQDVQGIRKFSEWKGSVVDSIVGTFLTQNVSDHLSSSAYMNIASRWPTSPKRPPVPDHIQSPVNRTTELHPKAKKMHGQPSDCQPGIEVDNSAAGVFASPSSPFDSLCALEDDCSPETPIWNGSKAKSPSPFLSDENKTVGPFEQGCAKGEVSWQGFAEGQAGWEPRVWDIEEAGGVAVTGLAVNAQPGRETCRPEAVPRGKERPPLYADGVDWEGVRAAGVAEIADAIKERGMHLMLAGRIKSFLEKVKDEHGRIDLEWLRTAPADSAREYLRGLHGLGTKSTECILLLCLHQPAFPVDTNVGRICVRLGWVPLEPLDEELQLHLLDQYPIQQRLQESLWRRLSHLGQRELYELHYQLITFGKVFCTKRQPNCLACPMRDECKHYASAKAHKEQKLAAPDPSPTPDQPTPQTPLPDSPSPPKRLEASAPPKPTHSSSSPLLPRRPVLQVGYEMSNGSVERKGHGASHSWAVLRATGPSYRAWYTEVRATGALFRISGQGTAGSLAAKGVEIRIANVVEGLSLLRDLRTLLAADRLRSAVLATQPLSPVQPTSSPFSKATAGSPAASMSPSRPARPPCPLLHLQAAQQTPNAPLLRLGQSHPGSPHAGIVPKMRGTALYTLVATAGQSNQPDSIGTRSQGGRPTFPVRPHASRLTTNPRCHLRGQHGARMPSGLGSVVNPSSQRAPANQSVPVGGKPGVRHLAELSKCAKLALTRLASLLAMRQALSRPPRLSPPLLEVTPALSRPRAQGTIRKLATPLAFKHAENFRNISEAASRNEPAPTGFGGSINQPTVSPVAPSPSVAALLRAAFATHTPSTPPIAVPQTGPMPDCSSGPIVPYRPFPVDPRSTLPGKPLLLPTPSFRQGFQPDQPGVTGLPDLNVPLAFPDEETARGLRETVKGAAIDARKRGIGRKKRVPTVFWALPLERPEKLRTLRHAVRLPEDHPLLRQFPRRVEDDPCPYFAVLWPASLVPAFPPPLPDLNDAPLEPVTPPLDDGQTPAASDVVAEPVYPKAGNAPAEDFDVSMVLADLLDEQRVADVTNVVNVGEEHEQAGTDTRSRAEPSPAGDVALPASCKEPEARTETLAALGIVSTVPTARSVFLDSPATTSAPEPSGPSDPPVEAPREVTCHHLIDTAPNGEVEKSAAARRFCAPSERSPESMVIRRRRSVLPIRGRTWRSLAERETGSVFGTRPGAVQERSGKRGPEETGLVIQTRGKKRRLEASAAGVDGSAHDGAVRLELVLRKVPRKLRTRAEFLLPGGAKLTSNLRWGKCEPNRIGAELTCEKGIAVAKEVVVGGLCSVKQEKNVCERLPVPGWALGESQSADRLVGSKRRPGESNREPFDQGAFGDPAGDGDERGALHGLKRVRPEVHGAGESMEDNPVESPQQLALLNLTWETAGPHTPVPDSLNCYVNAPSADLSPAGVSAGAVRPPPAAFLTAPPPPGVAIPPPYTGPYVPAGDSAADSVLCKEAAYSAGVNDRPEGPRVKAPALVPPSPESLDTPDAFRAALAPGGLLLTTRTSTAGEPNASQVSNSNPLVADVMPQEDDAMPPVSCPATPEKVRPNRPQMSPSPLKTGQVARVINEPGTAANGSPGARSPGREQPEASPCKCSTCCCRDEGTVFVTLLVPSRTAVGGRFPLNGTYFQTNELFADHATSHRPLTATAADFAGLPQCTVLFGTGAGNMFKACSLEAVREVFQHGYICVRGFDVTRRMPKPLSNRLHAGTAVKKQRGPVVRK